MNRETAIEELKGLLHDVLRKRFKGGRYDKLARVHGYADGYMKALLDLGVATESELLTHVGDVRRDFNSDAA